MWYWGAAINPTVEQGFRCIVVCQMLSNLYQDIKVFRYDDIIGEIYFLAGVDEGIELVMAQDGNWRFIDESEI